MLAPPGRRIIVAVAASAVAATLPVFLVGALAVQIRDDLQFGPSLQGALASISYGTVAVAALLLGASPWRCRCLTSSRDADHDRRDEVGCLVRYTWRHDQMIPQP